MSFRSKQPVAPPRHRSSSTQRNGSTNGSSSYSRPRSIGYFGSNTSPYSSPYNTSVSNNYSSSYSPFYGGYTSNYKSPYFQNSYRSGGNGYASLTIPAKALGNINLLNSNYGGKSYDNIRDYKKGTGESSHRSRQMTRTGSFNRDRSLSKSQSSIGSGMGSRSISLTSLNSEGYVVSFSLGFRKSFMFFIYKFE